MTLKDEVEAITRYEKAVEAHNETGKELEGAAEDFAKVAALARFPKADALVVRGDAGDEFDTVLSVHGIRHGDVVNDNEADEDIDLLSEDVSDALLTLAALGWTQLGEYEIPLR